MNTCKTCKDCKHFKQTEKINGICKKIEFWIGENTHKFAFCKELEEK